MGLFRKKEEPPEEEKSVVVNSELVYKLEKIWRTKEADYRYYLSEAEMLEWDDGTKRIQNMYLPDDMLRHGTDGWMGIASGDAKWAKKTAAHYGIEIEEPKRGD